MLDFFYRVTVFIGEDIGNLKRSLPKFHTVPMAIYITLRDLTSLRKFRIKTTLALLSGT